MTERTALCDVCGFRLVMVAGVWQHANLLIDEHAPEPMPGSIRDTPPR